MNLGIVITREIIYLGDNGVTTYLFYVALGRTIEPMSKIPKVKVVYISLRLLMLIWTCDGNAMILEERVSIHDIALRNTLLGVLTDDLWITDALFRDFLNETFPDCIPRGNPNILSHLPLIVQEITESLKRVVQVFLFYSFIASRARRA